MRNSTFSAASLLAAAAALEIDPAQFGQQNVVVGWSSMSWMSI